jgi:hypothetical protein
LEVVVVLLLLLLLLEGGGVRVGLGRGGWSIVLIFMMIGRKTLRVLMGMMRKMGAGVGVGC